MHIYHHSNHFVQNKYYRWYYNIINRALAENRKKRSVKNADYVYYETHHILPSAVFPEYSCLKSNPWNKVLLKAREHLVCHLLLPKFVADKAAQFKLTHALYAMTQQSNSQQQRHNSRLYSYAKQAMTAIRKDPIASKAWRNNLSKANKGTKNSMFGKTGPLNPFFGKTHTDETKKLLSAKAMGRKNSPEACEKMRGPRGAQQTPAPLMSCPHCGILTKKGNRWHFDRCRFRG